ncbi:MAG TPA: hypothetical protein VES60_15360 [Nakamurella sp.]|nr:hypothetical protein [Nakamurella sp.]
MESDDLRAGADDLLAVSDDLQASLVALSRLSTGTMGLEDLLVRWPPFAAQAIPTPTAPA